MFVFISTRALAKHLGIMQLNCRGLLRNIDDINSYFSELRPVAICLQETHLTDSHTQVPHHQVFRKDRHASNPLGGVAVVVQSGVACAQVPLQTSLKAVAVCILLDCLITLVSLYLPPSVPLHLHELQALIGQLPKPFLILSDFNAHHPLWGSSRQDSRGGVIERHIIDWTLSPE